MGPAVNDSAAARLQILDAAHQRFRTYGFGKTTMAEIADDAGMSAANLYRYFESKLDLGAACCARAMQQRIERLRAVVRDGSRTAAERLEEFMLESLRFTHELAGEEPRINEMVESITSRRPELVREKVQTSVSMLSEILAAGNASGEFRVDDVLATARTVQASMVLFEVPIFVGLFPVADYEREARRLARLLVRGLRAD